MSLDYDSIGNTKHVFFSNGEYNENVLETPTALPSSKPGTPQVSITLGSSDFPSATPDKIVFDMSSAFHVMVLNSDASNQTVNYDIQVNQVSIDSGTKTSTAGEYGTLTRYDYSGVEVGDDVEVYLWCDSSNVTYHGYFYRIVPTRVRIPNIDFFKDVTYTLEEYTPTDANLWLIKKGLYILGNSSGSTAYKIMIALTDGTTIPFQTQDDTYGLFGMDWADAGYSATTHWTDTATGHWDTFELLAVRQIDYRAVRK
jgi:hypothetical protein